MKKCLLVFSADPGGAECLVPVIKALPKKDFSVLLMSKRPATQVFEKTMHSFLKVDNLTFAQIEARLKKYAIHAVLTSASSLPKKDMTEKLLWRWAKTRRLSSIAVLDQWQAYTQRFSGVKNSEFMVYLPDKIAIMDELAKKEMMKEGFVQDRLCVTGQPSLEEFEKKIALLKSKSVKNRLKNKRKDMVFTFFSQPVKMLFGNTIGYDENTVFNDVVSIIPILEAKWKKKINLLCKLHPKNRIGDFVFKGYKGGGSLKFLKDKYPNQDLIVDSDIVLGMGSVMLIHSVLAGIPTVSYEPDKKNDMNTSMPVKVGAILCITDKRDLLNLIDKLRTDDIFLQQYLKRQKACVVHKGATKNVIALLESLLEAKNK